MFTLAFLGNIGLPQLIIIGIILLVIFGRKLPEVSRNLGKGIVEFKKGLAGTDDESIKNQQQQPPQQQFQQQIPQQPQQNTHQQPQISSQQGYSNHQNQTSYQNNQQQHKSNSPY